MVPQLLNVPDTSSFRPWSFYDDQHHRAVVAALARTRNIILPNWLLDPVAVFDLDNWLLREQAAHDDVNAILQTGRNNLRDVDLKDPEALKDWVYLHFSEHYAWSQILGVA